MWNLRILALCGIALIGCASESLGGDDEEACPTKSCAVIQQQLNDINLAYNRGEIGPRTHDDLEQQLYAEFLEAGCTR